MLNKNILAMVMAFICGGVIGWSLGYAQAINLCIETGQRFLDINLNEEALATLLGRFPEIIQLMR